MVTRITVIILSTFVCASYAQKSNLDLTALINTVFNTSNNDNNDNGGGVFDGNKNNPQPNPFDPTPTKTTILNPTPPPVSPIGDKYKSCGYQKECVPRFLCKTGEIEENGIGIIDIRIDGAECGYLEVCCDIPDKNTDKPVVVEDPHEGCGYRNPFGAGFKIVGDQSNEAQFAEFSWMAAILREEASPTEILNLYECGGALIAPTVVLTAAHCVQSRDANTLVVRAGEWDTQTKAEILPYQDQRVTEIIVHENFNKGSLRNDIALLIVASPFVWAPNVHPICLPPHDANFDHSRCFATGWGKDKFGREGKYQVILKKIDLPVVPNHQCQTNLRTTRLGQYFKLHESFICAGGEKDKDTCKGDGGSPLVCPIPGAKDRFYQAGIVAWGIGCGEEKIPGVYGNVPYLRPWIDEKLRARNIDFSSFTP